MTKIMYTNPHPIMCTIPSKHIPVCIYTSLPSGWDASPLQGYPGTHSYTWMGRGTDRVKGQTGTDCFIQNEL